MPGHNHSNPYHIWESLQCQRSKSEITHIRYVFYNLRSPWPLISIFIVFLFYLYFIVLYFYFCQANFSRVGGGILLQLCIINWRSSESLGLGKQQVLPTCWQVGKQRKRELGQGAPYPPHLKRNRCLDALRLCSFIKVGATCLLVQ